MLVLCLASSLIHAESVDDQIDIDPHDWPWWRGPQRVGVADPDQTPPTHWSETENVAWKTPIPGRGHSSPIVVADRVYLATADEAKDTQSLVALNRSTGKILWQSTVHNGGMMRKNSKSSGASSTPACDGQRLYINFANSNAVVLSALAIDGKVLWQTKVADYKIHQGYGASPALYRSLVIAIADSHAGGAIVGVDRKSGEIRWKHDRPKVPNYTSPILLRIAGQDQIILTGCNAITSLDPLTGKLLWETAGGTTESVTSTVTDDLRVFSSGGYPKNHLAAIAADGTGKIVWQRSDRLYVPSLLFAKEHLFGVQDAGVAACWRSDTGDEVWKHRLHGEFTASPVLVGDVIFATSETGETFLYKADPAGYREIAINKLGDVVFATPTICKQQIFYRAAIQTDASQQEFLYCLANQR
jgi:outer membrane protein assembly factor BamB